MNGLRYKEHYSHQTIDDACAFARKIGARRTWLVHMSHQAGLHADLQAKLPDSVFVAYDGLTIEI